MHLSFTTFRLVLKNQQYTDGIRAFHNGSQILRTQEVRILLSSYPSKPSKQFGLRGPAGYMVDGKCHRGKHHRSSLKALSRPPSRPMALNYSAIVL
jgi:hypothetical protein